ncbi:unnamed protein product [Meganyctiphanes norvegica]|uniref:Uncharacterized protein n=1 Tax=Meganyctiphanes norvegica TaxID=48144 RepID=A0AAV2SL22_MEGNR
MEIGLAELDPTGNNCYNDRELMEAIHNKGQTSIPGGEPPTVTPKAYGSGSEVEPHFQVPATCGIRSGPTVVLTGIASNHGMLDMSIVPTLPIGNAQRTTILYARCAYN